MAALPIKQDGFLATSVLVVMALLSVLTLVAIQRSTLSQRVVRQDTEFTDTYGTAEAGVERLIGTDLAALYDSGASSGTYDIGGSMVDYAIAPNTNATGVLIREGRTFDVVVDAGSEFEFSWERQTVCGPSPGNIPSGLLMTLIGDGNQVIRELYYDDHPGCTPESYGNENINSTTAQAVDLPNPVTVKVDDYTAVSSPKRIRFKALWTSAVLSIDSNCATCNLPPQGYQVEVESTGTAGESTANILFEQSIPQIPSIFDYAVFSGDTLVQE